MVQIDISLATYNGARFLPALLTSLARQTTAPDTIKVRDDGSLDETCLILVRERKAGMPIECLLDDIGSLGAAANFGHILSHCTGNYTLLADQDDLWHPNKVAELLACAQQLEKQQGSTLPILVYSDARIIDMHGAVLAPSASKWQGFDLHSGENFKRELIQNTVPGCSIMVNRSLLELALPIPDEAVMHDWWLMLVAHALGEVRCVVKALVDYRQHEANTIGAEVWNLRSIAKKLRFGPLAVRQRVQLGWQEALAQADVLHQRYANQMLPEKRKILESVLSLPQQGKLQRRITAAQLELHKEGVLRTLAWYWAL